MKSLDSPAESRHKHFGNQQVKIHNDLNFLLIYNFFERLTFIFMFYIKKHHLLSSGAKAKDKIPVETHYTISDYVYSEIFSSKVPNLIIHTVIRKKKTMVKQ